MNWTHLVCPSQIAARRGEIPCLSAVSNLAPCQQKKDMTLIHNFFSGSLTVPVSVSLPDLGGLVFWVIRTLASKQEEIRSQIFTGAGKRQYYKLR